MVNLNSVHRVFICAVEQEDLKAQDKEQHEYIGEHFPQYDTYLKRQLNYDSTRYMKDLMAKDRNNNKIIERLTINSFGTIKYGPSTVIPLLYDSQYNHEKKDALLSIVVNEHRTDSIAHMYMGFYKINQKIAKKTCSILLASFFNLLEENLVSKSTFEKRAEETLSNNMVVLI